MPVLDPSEYDISYFDGELSSLTHNAGYTRYKRWERNDPGFANDPGWVSSGEYFSDIARLFTGRYNMNNADVLIVGCAKGYIVQAFRALGINAWGIDVSSYAIGAADPEVQPYLINHDIRTATADFGWKNNEWDFVFSRWFLCCMSDQDMINLVPDLNMISRNMVHIVMNHVNPLYYNVRTPQEWADGNDLENPEINLWSWATQTIIVPSDRWDNYITVL